MEILPLVLVLAISAGLQFVVPRIPRFGGEIGRVLRPVRSLAQLAVAKGLIALAATKTGAPEATASLIERLLDIRPDAAVALGLVLLLDLITGVYASWWRKSEMLGRNARPKEFITSRRLRDSISKLGEYFVILLLVTVGANTWSTELGWAQEWVFMFLFLTELWSIRENLQHASAQGIVDGLKARFDKKNQGP
jgi:hypothetical protein